MVPERLAGVESDALERAFREHYADLLRLCTLLTGKQEMAEDIVQEAFVRVANRLSSLSNAEARPYLRRIVVNLWKNRLRRLSMERRQRLAPDSGATDPMTVVDTRDEIRQRLLSLSRRQRACLVLRYYEDLPEREVARILRCSVGSVKSQTSRALMNVRREMTK